MYRLTEADLDQDVPPDYWGAQLMPVMLTTLRSRPRSVLVSGPNGVGKTDQAWAMFRAARRQQLAACFTHGEAMAYDWHPGNGWRVPMTRRAWVAQHLADDRVRIISETADIRRYHHDHAWLHELARFPAWLVVDDLGATLPTPWVLDALSVLAQERRAWRRPTVWITRHAPEVLPDVLGPAIASRLLADAVVVLDGGDGRRDRRA